MKSWLARAAALALTTGIAACGSGAASAPAPTQTPTSASVSTSTPAPLPTGDTTSATNGVLGPYAYSNIINTNGYNTYVANNMWAAGGSGMTQKLTAADPGRWYVAAQAPAGNTAVLSYPNTNQLFNNWNGSGWNGSPKNSDTPISQLKQLTSTFAEDMNANSGTDAEAAYDIWLTNTSGPTEIMVWVDNVNRGTGGADQIGTGSFGGEKWTLLQYHGGEIIWSKNVSKQTGTVDILAMLRDLQAKKLVSQGASIGQIDFGFEICSTGGALENFSVSHFALTGK